MSTAAAVILIAAAVLLTETADAVPVSAASTVHATVTGSESVTSGTWGGAATPNAFTFTTNTQKTSTLSNTGTIALNQLGYKVVISNPTSGSPSFTLFVCTSAWSSGKCNGGSGTQIGGTYTKNTTTNVTSAVVPAVGGNVYLQATSSGISTSTTMTLTVTVNSSSQLRSAVVTNQ